MRISSHDTGGTRGTGRIALIGTYLPRACGIATFTFDLAETLAQQLGLGAAVMVIAMNDRPQGYVYPERVKFEIQQERLEDYLQAAEFLNSAEVDVVSLQHEFGIFGGRWGEQILKLLQELSMPVVVTCHTVYKRTDAFQKELFAEIASRSSKLVVMSRIAGEFLTHFYGLSRNKIAVIPHGIHDMPFIEQSPSRKKFTKGGRVLLTFGLLHRNKGIEYMIKAMPAILDRHPETTYVILGATHPRTVKKEGETYRESLTELVKELHLEDRVLFYPRFMMLDELIEHLNATDIFVTPYLSQEYATSGALAYALGAGKAVVSTPYWYAEEMLSGGRGSLVPMRDVSALACEIIKLLDDEKALQAMRRKAYAACRHMIWQEVARSYLALFEEVRSHVPAPITASQGVSTRKRAPDRRAYFLPRR